MTSVEEERGDRTSQKDVSPPDISDSGVSNGSSSCLSENGGHAVTEAASKPPVIVTAETSNGTPVRKTSYLSVDEQTEKGLSCLSLEVCASGENINLLNQDDLSECGSSGSRSMGSVDRELNSEEFSNGRGAERDEEEQEENGMEKARMPVRNEQEGVASNQDSSPRRSPGDCSEGTKVT